MGTIASLNLLAACATRFEDAETATGIYPILAPHADDAALRSAVDALREKGEIVIVDLPGHEPARAELGCNRRLVRRGKKWEVEAL
jgi:hypothetical protein